MLNTVWQTHITHQHLGNGYRQCLFAPYLSSIVNPKGQRLCSFFGIESYPDALTWYQQMKASGYRVDLRPSQRVNTRYEVKVWGLTTEEFMSFWRQLAEQRKQPEASCLSK